MMEQDQCSFEDALRRLNALELKLTEQVNINTGVYRVPYSIQVYQVCWGRISRYGGGREYRGCWVACMVGKGEGKENQD